MTEADAHPLTVDAYGSSAPSSKKLNEAIKAAWTEMLSDNDARQEAAEILGIKPDEFAKHFPLPPYEAEPNEAGMGPVEIAILVFVGNVAYDVAKALAVKGVDAALTALWGKVLQPKVGRLLPFGSLDDKKPVEGEGRDNRDT